MRWNWQRPAISQLSARPIWIAFSTAPWLIRGSTPGWPRQSGHVSVFGSAPNRFSQRQNIFVRVFSWTWISRPITGSHSGTNDLPRLAKRILDRPGHLDHREPLLERVRVHPDQPELALARLERELQVADQDGARAVEHAWRLPEHPLGRGDELGRGVDDAPHAATVRRRSGTTSNSSARSSAW